jgi:DNA-binding helix-hairpin-helix protein with protein kinase domain
VTRLYDASGHVVALGSELARGGEGAIFELAHNQAFVAKIYHRAVDQEKIDKLNVMAHAAVPQLLSIAAWPISTLHQAPGAPVVGILMPKICGCQQIHQLYSPAERKETFPRADWAFLAHVARNCAAAFETVHHCGHIIGDVNQSGVLVSHNATVRLIDCDSFQVRTSDRLFHCVVGVPQYTPPELQGQSFDRVERTANHDSFGLALLIFHLLFMGRHPFAGRFMGSGDMPIEKAISEGRFAFSSMSQRYLMTPPPYSLPLAVLPRNLADMFERAFALPVNGSLRPSPAQWREALDELKKTLKTCGADHGHRYPSNVARCPWCQIIREGGPNFFISVVISISGILGELPAVDFTLIWKRTEAIPAPPADRPDYPPAPDHLTPRPLPPDVVDSRLLFNMVRVVAIGSSILVIAALDRSALAELVGLALFVIFGIWWIILAATSSLQREHAARRDIVRRLQSALYEEQRRWDHIAHEATSRFEHMKNDLESVAERAAHLSAEFQQERQALDAQRRHEFLREFLDTKFIRNYSIEGIGPGRRAMLLSFDIETAADVTEEKLRCVDGLGQENIRQLFEWRHKLETDFRYDPQKPIPPEKIRSLIMKYRELQQRSGAALTAGEYELRSITEAATRELGNIAQRIADLVNQIRQAKADLKAR